MSTWLSDMLSATPFGSMNLMYNQCYADSTARWYMNNPWTNNFAFSPYSFNMGFNSFLNPIISWNFTAQNIFGNCGAWNVQQPFSPWGWYQQTTNNNSNSNTTDPTEDMYKDRYNKLYNIVKAILIDDGGDEDDRVANGELTAKINGCSKKKTYKEKYEALKALYVEYEVDDKDLQAYLEKSNLKISIGKTQSDKATIYNLLLDSGYRELSPLDKTTTAVNNIESQIKALGNSQGDLSALEISKTDVLAVISAYNDTKGDLIDKVMTAVNGISNDQQRGTAESCVQSLITALTSRANDLKDSKYLDEKTKENITEAIKALNAKTIGNTEDFKMAFNDLYVLTRLANARIIEKSLNNQFGFLKQGIGGFVTENTIKDLEDENIKTSGIDSLKSQIKIAESTGRRRSDNIDDKDTTQQQIEKLEKAGYIAKVPDAKVEECQVYKVVADGSFIMLGTDDQIYKVTKTKDSYAAETDTVKAKDIEAAGKKAQERKELEEKLSKNDKITSEKTDNGTVYKVTIKKETHTYVITEDNKLQEIDSTMKNVGTPITYDELDKQIKEASKPKVSIKVSNLSKQIMKDTAIGQGNWNAYDSNFKKGLENCLKGIKDAFAENSEYYTLEEWNDAYDATINYYKDALGSLCTVTWNQLYEKDQTKGIEVDSYKDQNDRTCNFQCYIDRTGENVDSYVELKNRNKSDSTDIYVGCDWDSWGYNDFYIYINPDRAIEKFKSFLPKK